MNELVVFEYKCRRCQNVYQDAATRTRTAVPDEVLRDSVMRNAQARILIPVTAIHKCTNMGTSFVGSSIGDLIGWTEYAGGPRSV